MKIFKKIGLQACVFYNFILLFVLRRAECMQTDMPFGIVDACRENKVCLKSVVIGATVTKNDNP